MAEAGWSAQELARMQNAGKGCLAEEDGRCFMALLDMCHFLVDQITQVHNFKDIEEASRLRGTRMDQAAMLTAQMYSYWYAAPAGPGVYEMLHEWTASQPGVGVSSRMRGELHGRKQRQGTGMSAALHALAKNECANWPRRRKTGAFLFAGEDASGAALLADEQMECVYRVVGLSTSLGDLIRASGRGAELIGSSMLLTLLPYMGVIVYDGTLRGAPPRTDASTLAELKALADKALADGSIVRQLPEVADTPLLGQRVVVSGLQAKPELNGLYGFAGDYDDAKGRYAVTMENEAGAYKLKPDNLSKAPPRSAAEDAASTPALTTKELALQERLKAASTSGDMWVFRRMGYTEAENPMHMGMIMSGKSGMVMGQFRSKLLAPTAAEYLEALENAVFRNALGANGQAHKPQNMAVDDKGAVERLQLVLTPALIQAGYYPPPSEEELSAMGVS